jgi:hypothetical protein
MIMMVVTMVAVVMVMMWMSGLGMLFRPAALSADDEAAAGQNAIVVIDRGEFDLVDQGTQGKCLRQARFEVGPKIQKGGDEHVAGDAAYRIEMQFQHDRPFRSSRMVQAAKRGTT